MDEVRVCVFGGRDFCMDTQKSYINDWVFKAFDCIDFYIKDMLAQNLNIIFIDGKATGADTVGFKYALTRGFDYKRFPAKWRVNGVYNPGAGHLRNTEMLMSGTHFIGF